MPETFPAYFRLSLPSGTVSRADLDALLAVAKDTDAIVAALRMAATQKTASGVSKVRGLLERLMDHVSGEMNAEHAQPVISALFRVGDELLLATDKVRGGFDFGNESRVSRVAYHLLKKVPAAARVPMLVNALNNGEAIRCAQYLFGSLVEQAEKGEGDALVDLAEAERLKAAWQQKIGQVAQVRQFIDHPDLAWLLNSWWHWGGEDQVKAWWQAASSSDLGLLKLVAAFSSEATSQVFGDHAVRVQLRVNPKRIARYGDLDGTYARVAELVRTNTVPEPLAPAAAQFLREYERMKAGEDPDSIRFIDD